MVDPHSTLKIQQKSKIPLNLRLSDTGEINLSGDIKPEDLQAVLNASQLRLKICQEHEQAVLDASQLRLKICQEHEQRLNRENNLAAIYIGFIVSSLLGLSIFCLFNKTPKVQHQYSIQSTILGVSKC